MDDGIVKRINQLKRETAALKAVQAIPGSSAKFYIYTSSSNEFSGSAVIGEKSTHFTKSIRITTDKPAIIDVSITRSVAGGAFYSAGKPIKYTTVLSSGLNFPVMIMGDVFDSKIDEKSKTITVDTYPNAFGLTSATNPVVHQDFRINIVASQPFNFKII